MTDSNLMDADCIHGRTWWDCPQCDEVDIPEPPEPAAAPSDDDPF